MQLQFAPFHVFIFFLKAATFSHDLISSLKAFQRMLPLKVTECLPKAWVFICGNLTKFLILRLYSICLVLKRSQRYDGFSKFRVLNTSNISFSNLKKLFQNFGRIQITCHCNSVTLVSIPMSSNLFFRFFGVVPSVPMTIGMPVPTCPTAFYLSCKVLIFFDLFYLLGIYSRT